MRVSKKAEDEKDKRFAEIYVFEHTGNALQSYLQLIDEYGMKQRQSPSNQRSAAAKYCRKPNVQRHIQECRQEAQEKYDVQKTEIVLALQDIAFDKGYGVKDRLTALKQLTDIGGFATQNVNLNTKADIEVVIEGD